MVTARAHYHKTCKHGAMRMWLFFVQVQREKYHMTRAAKETHTHALIVRVWSHWKGNVLKVQELVQFEEEVEVRSRRAKCRRALVHWQLCILLDIHYWHNLAHLGCLCLHFDHKHLTIIHTSVVCLFVCLSICADSTPPKLQEGSLRNFQGLISAPHCTL